MSITEKNETPFQRRVQPWMIECFGPRIAADTSERNHRFFEEATELVQAGGMSQADAHMLVDYVYGRPVGEKPQEVGGVMITLAALCLADGMDMHAEGETELARIWTKVEEIRIKQASKPKNSPLPAVPVKGRTEAAGPGTAAARDVLAERERQKDVEGWTPDHDDEHGGGELAVAAACYAVENSQRLAANPPPSWPWDARWWKPKGNRRNLVKAGALLLAEIERIDRAVAAADKGGA